MDSLLGVLLLSTLACALASTSLDFRVTPSVVDPSREKNVTLSCSVYDYTRESIATIRIFKNYEAGWRLVAQIIDLEPNTVHVKDQSISAQTGNLEPRGDIMGQLAISWSPATSSTLGQYKCFASRYTTDQNLFNTKAATISLGSQLDALAILRVMRNDRDEVLEKLEELTEKTERYQQGLKTTVAGDFTDLKDELTKLESALNETMLDQDKKLGNLDDQFLYIIEESLQEQSVRLEKLSLKVQNALDRGFLLLWPRGSYALPKPSTGCPASAGVTWETGFREHHTESIDRNKDAVSEGNHLVQPVRSTRSGQINFVTQRFCVKTDHVSPGPSWPKGTYCINKRGECPAFFTEGTITWDDRGPTGQSSKSGPMPDGKYFVSNTTFFYCCRKDRPADEPVDLPRSQPFYLYRHEGKCQQVAGMSVSEEFIRFDTQSVNNKDASTGEHPDVTLNDIVLQLCYYEQSSD